MANKWLCCVLLFLVVDGVLSDVHHANSNIVCTISFCAFFCTKSNLTLFIDLFFQQNIIDMSSPFCGVAVVGIIADRARFIIESRY
jgi:hypothetical protein